jgi:hypothetical protein
VYKTGTSAQAIQTTLRQVVALVFTGAPAKLSGRFGIVIVD